jgi:hypothetical protein
MEKPRVVKVRVNASGLRIIGFVHLPDGVYRTSDVLNAGDPYLLIQDTNEPSPLEKGGFRAVLKDSISYVEALEEPSAPQGLKRAGLFTLIAVELRFPVVRMEGVIFTPEDQTPYEVVNDGRRFISLRNVQFHKSVERYDYLAVGKEAATLLEWLPATAR